jgi:transcriptional regulator with XRE-family HTH domain
MDRTLPALDHGDGGALDHEQAGPTAARMCLGAELRQLREDAHISREDAGEAIRASASKISRLELGRTGFKSRDVADLLELYGLHGEAERATLLALARHANTPDWWHSYSDVVPAWFDAYLGLEQAASLIRGYEVQFIPGLLQTEQYARAVLGLADDAAGERLERRLAVRMHRQQILHRPSPPRLWAVIDEAALRRPIGGAATLRGQIEHLITIAQLSHVKIQLLPFRSGGHAAAGGPVTLLRFPGDQIPGVVYLEQLSTAIYPRGPGYLLYYWNVLNRVATEAETPAATIASLRRMRNQV